jgi:NAD(P)-dependent dehydrogenase (short-subunit alcohol dehydrogenase family)
LSHVLDKFKLDSELVLITGGSGLLGSQYCKSILEAGALLVAIDINIQSLKTLKENLKEYDDSLLTLEADITNEESLEGVKKKIFKKWGFYPTVLINNAAIDPKFEKNSKIPESRLEIFSRSQWDFEISVGLTGAFLCSRLFGSEMAKNNKGVILNISSDLGVIAPDQRLYEIQGEEENLQPVKPPTYSVIKHGLIGLTKYLSTYWAHKGVRCNTFAPGGVFNNHPQLFTNKINDRIPMKRMANIDEYNATIVYLCSPACSYLNGETIIMDGGRSVW